MLLEVRNLCAGYGAIEALHGISLQVEQGQVVSLIGANGAGKSTTLNTISGLIRPNRGEIRFEGADITGWRPDRITRRIACVPGDLLRHEMLTTRTAPPDRVLAEIVDEVFLPLVRPCNQ